MPSNAIGWTSEEEQKLVELVKPHSLLYNIEDPSRKNILARENTWKKIAADLSKPVEECKKRWRGLRDGFMRSKRQGYTHTKPMYEKLIFLDGGTQMESFVDYTNNLPETPTILGMAQHDNIDEGEQDVIVDEQEYYEITFMPESNTKNVKQERQEVHEEPVVKKIKAGRKKKSPIILKTSTPVKILPKPNILLGNKVMNPAINGQIQQRIIPRLTPLVQEPVKMLNTQDSRSPTMDKLIEKVLSENTNEIDIFFRSMAASVKKLKPSLIPKVKMEVCNVIAKYEIQDAEQPYK